MGKGNSTFSLPPSASLLALALCPRVNAIDSRSHGTCSLLVHESRCMPSVETHRIRPVNGPQMPVSTLVPCLHEHPLCVPAHLRLESHFWAGCHGQKNACPTGPHRLRLQAARTLPSAHAPSAGRGFSLILWASNLWRDFTDTTSATCRQMLRRGGAEARRKDALNPLVQRAKLRACPIRHASAQHV